MSVDAESVWRAFGDRLRRFIRKSVANEADADDVLQEVFLRLQSGLPGLRDAGRLEAWIFQVTRFAIADHLRSRTGARRPLALPEELATEPSPEDVNGVVASWLTPLLQELPEEDREALRLSALGGASQVSLAERLRLSPSGARSRVQRARRRLKDALLKCCQIELDRRGNALSYSRKGGCAGDCSCD